MQPAGSEAPWAARLKESLLDFARWAHGQLLDADGVGVTVLLGDQFVFAASTSFGESLDTVQYTLGEGPCVSAVDVGAVVRSSSIGSDESRWSRFTPRAAELGLRSVVSIPLRPSGTSARVVGSLNLYRMAADGLDTTESAALKRVVTSLRGPVTSARTLAVADANTAILKDAARERARAKRSGASRSGTGGT